MLTRLYLAQRATPIPLDFHGFTVKPGMWYGFIKTPFGPLYAAWSGWTCCNQIALYTLARDGWELHWVDDDEVYSAHVCGLEDYEGGDYEIEEIPWFAFESM